MCFILGLILYTCIYVFNRLNDAPFYYFFHKTISIKLCFFDINFSTYLLYNNMYLCFVLYLFCHSLVKLKFRLYFLFFFDNSLSIVNNHKKLYIFISVCLYVIMYLYIYSNIIFSFFRICCKLSFFFC